MNEILPPRALVLTWVCLLGLLMATLVLAYVPMGPFNLVTGLVISTIKTVLVAVLFMKLLRGPLMIRVAAAAGLFWLSFLFVLSATDYLTRETVPAESYFRNHVTEREP
jgi:cytochrome c oxidase subunit 4